MKKQTIAFLTTLTLGISSLYGCSGRAVSETATMSGSMTDSSTAKGSPNDVPAAMEGGAAGSDAEMAYVATETEEWYDEPYIPPYVSGWNTETYEKAEENGYYLTASSPLSTFSASADTASYANVRRMIEDGYAMSEIPSDAVRPEEFVNYFSYALKRPQKGEAFGATFEAGVCPWNEKHELLMIGLRTEDIDMKNAPDSNLVFLLDVSGSMSDDDKLPLLQKSFKQLVEGLSERDRVSIVTYASGVETVLSGAKGSEKGRICDAIDALYASGSTNGEGGIEKAYELAKRNFIQGGNNRVIIASDGDMNVGASTPDALQRLIESKRDDGIFLSVLGFGMGNLKDSNMERLAQYGNGNYAYIDSLLEAKKVLVEEMGSTLVTVAKDVKLQVEFNPDNVNAYRLIGYENRQLNAADFNDDTKDGGEIGAGHAVVALYEIIPTGSADEITLKYDTGKDAGTDTDGRTGKSETKGNTSYADEYATVSIRYKEPDGDASKLESHVISKDSFTKHPSDDFTFAAAAAEFAMLLSDSPHKGSASLEGILQTLKTMHTDDEYRNEFYYLVRQLTGRG